MTTAATALQHALVATLSADAALMAMVTGVYDGPPSRAPYPYLTFSDASQSDWSTKTALGREIRLAVTVWDDGEVPARLHALMAQTEDCIALIPRTLPGWHIASLVFLRSQIVRDPAGPWAGMIEHRARLLASG